jgi:hypothetical protein
VTKTREACATFLRLDVRTLLCTRAALVALGIVIIVLFVAGMAGHFML